MSALSLRLPNSLHKQLRELAISEGISINQLISSAVAEKMAALMTADYLEQRAERGNRHDFQAALAKVPDVKAGQEDRLPDETEAEPDDEFSKGRDCSDR